MISVGYSALNSTLKISGIATARAKSDIRVISINSTRLDNMNLYQVKLLSLI